LSGHLKNPAPKADAGPGAHRTGAAERWPRDLSSLSESVAAHHPSTINLKPIVRAKWGGHDVDEQVAF
jgi:hypothetical protein